MKKKLLTLLMATVLTVVSCVPVFADSYHEDGTHNCPVYATLDSAYSVNVPASITLTDPDGDQDYEGDYVVYATGRIAENKYVTITPASSFQMNGAVAATPAVTANVRQATTSWRRTPDAESVEMGEVANGFVTATITVADAYTGNLQFTFAMNTDTP